jgi:hypothetical protein
MSPKKAPATKPLRLRAAHAVVAGAIALAGVGTAGAVASTVPVRCSIQGTLPDKTCTPGALNPKVTQANINKTICVTGWTATVRPPVSYTDPLKQELMRAYGETGPATGYELDHFIALELGGNPTSPTNLWPEPYTPVPGAHEKDKVENYLHKQVCGGQMSLAQAQQKISTDWLSVWNQIKP